MSNSGQSPALLRRRRWLVAYLLVQSVLTLCTPLAPVLVREWLTGVVYVAALVTLLVSMVRGWARPLAGWAPIAVSLGAAAATNVVVIFTRGVDAVVPITDPVTTTLASLVNPLLAIGLAVLSRRTPRQGPADGLDAAMVALAAFLLAWTFLLEPAAAGQLSRIIPSAAFPAGIALLLAAAVKIVLGHGLRNSSTSLLIAGALLLMGANIHFAVTGALTSTVRGNTVVDLAWLAFAVLVGASALQWPTLGEAHHERDTTHVASTLRLVILGLLMQVPPLAWLAEYLNRSESPDHPVGFAIALVTTVIFVDLLAARFGLIIRFAQVQAALLREAIAAQEALQQQLAHRASHDPLTGLPNRAMLTEHLEKVLPQWPGRNAVMLMDIDDFKKINDTLGHQAGDELLVQVARRLGAITPQHWILARLGGDEFAAFGTQLEPGAARDLAERYVRTMRPAYDVQGRQLSITASVGLFETKPSLPPTVHEAMDAADVALYAAKAAGRDRFAAYHPGLTKARQRGEDAV